MNDYIKQLLLLKKYDEIKLDDIGLSDDTIEKLNELKINNLNDLLLVSKQELRQESTIDRLIFKDILSTMKKLKLEMLVDSKLSKNDLEKKLNEKKYNEIKIENFDFSVRVYNALKRHGINNLYDLLYTSEQDLKKLNTFGKQSCDEIQLILNKIGLDYLPKEYVVKERLSNKIKNHKYEQISIEELEFTTKTSNQLKKAKISTLQELISKSKFDIRRIERIRKDVYDEIIDKIDELGLSFYNPYTEEELQKMNEIEKEELLKELSYLLKRQKELIKKNEEISLRIEEINSKLENSNKKILIKN